MSRAIASKSNLRGVEAVDAPQRPGTGPTRVLQRQCACGTQGSGAGMCRACRGKRVDLRRRLAVGSSDDPLEREADRIADQVMLSPAYGAMTRAPLRLQRFAQGMSGEATEAPMSVERVLAMPGQPLEPALRKDMEGRFGYDFSRVRVHANTSAEQSARDVQADAYTVGHDIVFGAGRYMPHSFAGRRLLAHELAHTVQQDVGSHRLMRTRWTTSEGIQPSGDYLVAGIDAIGSISLAPVPGNTEHCVFTPLFHVSEERVANNERLIVRATAWNPDGRSRAQPGPDWRINVFEYFNAPSPTPQYGCDSDRGVNAAWGDMSDTLQVSYPQHGGWSSRNLFVRVRNGSPDEILVRLAFEYPQAPQPSSSDQLLDSLQTAIQLLGLTEPLGIFFDGLDAVISAARGRWLEAGISAAAMVPFGFGQATTLVRWIRKSGGGRSAVIGLHIPQRALRGLPPDEVVRLIRESSEFLAHARPPDPGPLRRALGSRGEPVDTEVLDLAFRTRVRLAGVTERALTGINVAVARLRVGDRIEFIATRSTTREAHSEEFLLREVQRMRTAHPNEPVIVEQVFTERHPCIESLHRATTRAACFTVLENFEREQITLAERYGIDGRLDVYFGVPQQWARSQPLRELYGLPSTWAPGRPPP